MSNRSIIGIAALACIACCIGPILAVVGAIAALGAISTGFIGVIGLAIVLTASTAGVVIVRKPRQGCAGPETPTRVRLTRRASPPTCAAWRSRDEQVLAAVRPLRTRAR